MTGRDELAQARHDSPANHDDKQHSIIHFSNSRRGVSGGRCGSIEKNLGTFSRMESLEVNQDNLRTLIQDLQALQPSAEFKYDGSPLDAFRSRYDL